MSERKQDFLASEIISELKNENIHKDSLIKRLYKVIAFLAATSAIALGGLLLEF